MQISNINELVNKMDTLMHTLDELNYDNCLLYHSNTLDHFCTYLHVKDSTFPPEAMQD